MQKKKEASFADAAGPVERVGRIAQLIESSAGANEELGRLTPEVVDALHAQRLFRLLLPRAYGGEEVDHVTWFRTMEALAKLDASTAWCVGQINGCAATAASVDPAVARAIWSGPRSALSWGPPVKARADAVDGGHRLTGEWQMSSGSRHANWIGLTAPVFDRKGQPIQLEGAPMRIFLVPAEQVEWVENWNVIGLVATNSGGFRTNGLFVPDGYSVAQLHPLKARLTLAALQVPDEQQLRYRLLRRRARHCPGDAGCLHLARQGEDAAGSEALAQGQPPHPVPGRRGRSAPAVRSQLHRVRRHVASGTRSPCQASR